MVIRHMETEEVWPGCVWTENILRISQRELKQLLKNKIERVECTTLPRLTEKPIKVHIEVSDFVEERELRRSGYKPSIFSPFIKQWH